MRKLLAFALILFLVSCGNTKQVIEPLPESHLPTPSWIISRPVSSMDYIGIGRASKIGPMEEYQAIAKKNAMNDMAGEIQVKVSANSLLYTLEHDDRFSESFSERISTQTNMDLEGFEAYDSYETPNEYWVYYRLDKVKFQEIKAERHAKAIERASNDRALAQKARLAGNVDLAATYYIKSIEDLKAYWGEDNVYPGMESEGAIDKNALSELMDMRNNFKLKSDQTHIKLDIDNEFEQSVLVRAMVDGRNTEAVPFIYRQGKGDIQTKESDQVRIQVRPGDETREVLSIEVDPFMETRKALIDPALAFLKNQLKGEVLQIDVAVIYPSMSLDCKQSFEGGEAKNCDALRSAMMMEMAKSSIAMDMNSPYRINILAKSKNGGINQGFQVVYTDILISGQDLKSDEIRFEKEIDSVKGVHSNLESATTKSLQKGAELINKELLKALLDAMF